VPTSPLPEGPRRAAIVLWCVGAALAGFTGVLSLAHSLWFYAAVYTAVGTGLAFLGLLTARGHRAAGWISLVALGSQLAGAAGSAWESAHPHTDSAKARHLRDLGLNYRWSVFANLVYSLTAGAVFLWAVSVRARSRRPSFIRPSDPDERP
jgi:hypothetical protein